MPSGSVGGNGGGLGNGGLSGGGNVNTGNQGTGYSTGGYSGGQAGGQLGGIANQGYQGGPTGEYGNGYGGYPGYQGSQQNQNNAINARALKTLSQFVYTIGTYNYSGTPVAYAPAAYGNPAQVQNGVFVYGNPPSAQTTFMATPDVTSGQGNGNAIAQALAKLGKNPPPGAVQLEASPVGKNPVAQAISNFTSGVASGFNNFVNMLLSPVQSLTDTFSPAPPASVQKNPAAPEGGALADATATGTSAAIIIKADGNILAVGDPTHVLFEIPNVQPSPPEDPFHRGLTLASGLSKSSGELIAALASTSGNSSRVPAQVAPPAPAVATDYSGAQFDAASPAPQPQSLIDSTVFTVKTVASLVTTVVQAAISGFIALFGG